MAHEPLELIINLLESDESEARDFESNRPRFGSIRLKIRSKSSKNSGSVVSPTGLYAPCSLTLDLSTQGLKGMLGNLKL
jgi:hypothetical protein